MYFLKYDIYLSVELTSYRMSKEKNAIKRVPYPILAALADFPAWLAWYLVYKNA